MEEQLPHLLEDIRDIVDSQSQTDPSFKTTRLYTRLSAAEVRRQLIAQKGYTDEELPSRQGINRQLQALGYHLRKVAKTKPRKKIPETDAIFEHLHQVNRTADAEAGVLRLSLDAKATIKVGPFSRGGSSRVPVEAADHDFQPTMTVTVYGILLPQQDRLFLYLTPSKVTSDFIVDRLEGWWQAIRSQFPHVQVLVLNLDCGPENQSRRTQFIKRLVGFAQQFQITIRLAYYPPYHSKYNAIERCWAALENHWNGTLLQDLETIFQWAQTMTWNGSHPQVELVAGTYETGVRLTPKDMAAYEAQIQRLPTLEKWFVEIPGGAS